MRMLRIEQMRQSSTGKMTMNLIDLGGARKKEAAEADEKKK
jgi:hypothetical protein